MSLESEKRAVSAWWNPALEFEEGEESGCRLAGTNFRKLKGQRYRYDYCKLAFEIADKKIDVVEVLRQLARTDLFFLLCFVLRVPTCNHPFVVDACLEVDNGPKSNTLDIWAREHFKSSIITICGVIQRILADPEERICIFSYRESAARSFLRVVRHAFESSHILPYVFTDILWANPTYDAPKWSETEGLFVKRKSYAKEATLEAYGLIEGMPTGKHFTGRVYDDVETADSVFNLEQAQRLKDMFDLSQNLGVIGGWHRVTGTPYSHEGLLIYLENKKDAEGKQLYLTRRKAATVDGTPNGKSVLLPEETLAERRTNRRMFFCQQLCDPTPSGEVVLNAGDLIEVDETSIPKQLYRFMTVDPAGQRRDGRTGDSWGIFLVGVEPFLDDIGASSIYILDCVIDVLCEADAMEAIVKMYSAGGKVIKLGVEKVAMMTAEVHVCNALRLKGKNVTLENGSLTLLRPAGRSKQQRIESSLAWPLRNGKVHISKSIPNGFRERLKLEMRKFPFWHDDGLDALAYVYDILSEFKFPKRYCVDAPNAARDVWKDAFNRYERKLHSWLYV